MKYFYFSIIAQLFYYLIETTLFLIVMLNILRIREIADH